MEIPASPVIMGPPSHRPTARRQEPKADSSDFKSSSRSSSKSATQRARETEVLLPNLQSPQILHARPDESVINSPVHEIVDSPSSKSTLDDCQMWARIEPEKGDTIGSNSKQAPEAASGKSLETKKLKAKCLYRLEYRDQSDNLLHEKESDNEAGAKPPKREDESAIEVITTIRVRQKQNTPPTVFQPQFARGKNEGTELRINSLHLINALRAVVSYYPGAYLLEEPLTFSAPYRLLVHHRKDLREYKDNHPANHTEDYIKETNQHIDILLNFLHDHFEGDLEAEEERHQQEPPMCTFEYAWMLFPPGADIYTLPMSYPPNATRSVHVVYEVSGGLCNSEYTPYTIGSWSLESDGEFINRYGQVVEIAPFDGAREVRTLQAYPMSTMKADEKKEIEKLLMDRGRKYYEYTSISHKQFNGYNMFSPRRRFDTQIVLDTFEYMMDDDEQKHKQRSLDLEFDGSTGVRGCSCEDCSKTKNPEGKATYATYDRIKLKAVNPTGELTDHQYLVCNQRIPGFTLKQKTWELLDMDSIRNISFDKEVMNELVLDPPGNKNLIKALAKRYTEPPADLQIGPESTSDLIAASGLTRAETWSADRIEGKGEGQIILLHGPPGVGKTLTAESVAEFVERPLLSLSVSDIGIKAEDVEDNLKKWMERARRWGAILLIDEADIYLEERSPHNFEHNSLVSVFLRSLEYYAGILFLTTNRVGVFDEAFASRIHIPIGYSLFNETIRETVWENMIKRLERERKDSIQIPLSFKKYVKNDKDLKKLEWNGREIRNAFQTAVSLAEFQAKEERLPVAELKDEFLDQVVQMSLRFKDYLATFPGGNARKKAWHYGKRNDDFVAGK